MLFTAWREEEMRNICPSLFLYFWILCASPNLQEGGSLIKKKLRKLEKDTSDVISLKIAHKIGMKFLPK